jgi:hypothetical protein
MTHRSPIQATRRLRAGLMPTRPPGPLRCCQLHTFCVRMARRARAIEYRPTTVGTRKLRISSLLRYPPWSGSVTSPMSTTATSPPPKPPSRAVASCALPPRHRGHRAGRPRHLSAGPLSCVQARSRYRRSPTGRRMSPDLQMRHTAWPPELAAYSQRRHRPYQADLTESVEQVGQGEGRLCEGVRLLLFRNTRNIRFTRNTAQTGTAKKCSTGSCRSCVSGSP